MGESSEIREQTNVNISRRITESFLTAEMNVEYQHMHRKYEVYIFTRPQFRERQTEANNVLQGTEKAHLGKSIFYI